MNKERYVIIENGEDGQPAIVNTIVYDGKAEFDPGEGRTLMLESKARTQKIPYRIEENGD